MRHNLLIASSLTLLIAAAGLVSGCAGGGGGGGGGGAPAMPAYVNGTSTGTYTNNDFGFYLGARTVPTTLVNSTPTPVLRFDIGNGFTTAKSAVKWRVLQDGIAFANGATGSISSLSWVDVDVNITPGGGTHVYRIEIDYLSETSETNENNNWVEVTIVIPVSG